MLQHIKQKLLKPSTVSGLCSLSSSKEPIYLSLQNQHQVLRQEKQMCQWVKLLISRNSSLTSATTETSKRNWKCDLLTMKMLPSDATDMINLRLNSNKKIITCNSLFWQAAYILTKSKERLRCRWCVCCIIWMIKWHN